MKKTTLRKNNVIAYKSNFYTLPEGSYTGVGSYALIKADQSQLFVYDLQKTLICSHVISTEKGKTIINTNHKRDTSKSLDKMAEQVSECFSDKGLVNAFLKKIKEKWPRYTRDHFQSLLKALPASDMETADRALAFCMENNIFHGAEFEQVLHVFNDEKPKNKTGLTEIKPLDKKNALRIDYIPKTSNIDDYEKYI